MFAFVLFIEIWTALANGTVHIGSADVGVPPLLGAFIADGVALVIISVTSRPTSACQSNDESSLYRFNCSQCGWTIDAATVEEARALGQEHRRGVHGGRP